MSNTQQPHDDGKGRGQGAQSEGRSLAASGVAGGRGSVGWGDARDAVPRCSHAQPGRLLASGRSRCEFKPDGPFSAGRDSLFLGGICLGICERFIRAAFGKKTASVLRLFSSVRAQCLRPCGEESTERSPVKAFIAALFLRLSACRLFR